MSNQSPAYQALCSNFYDLDKPFPTVEELSFYLKLAKEASGSILEPMCGTGRFLIPLLEQGYSVTGFDSSAEMLHRCHQKCLEKHLTSNLHQADFETFLPSEIYQLIFIPSGSFGHLISPKAIDQALTFIATHLKSGGKFVVEIETPRAVRHPQNIWRGKWVTKADGSKIVLNVLSEYNSISKVETGLFRYELWAKNTITHYEVEEYQVKYYEPKEIELLFKQHDFKVAAKWDTRSFVKLENVDESSAIIYECVKE